MSDILKKDPTKATILFGPSFLRPEAEKDHYGLYRYLLIEKHDPITGQFVKENAEPPIGPLMVFRVAYKDDRVDMRTIHPETMQEISLTKVWDGRKGFV